MKCEYCGRTLAPGQTECPGCGATIENPEPLNKQDQNGAGKIEVKVNGLNISIDGLGKKNAGGTGPINMSQAGKSESQPAGYTSKQSDRHTEYNQVPPTPGYTGNNATMMQDFMEYGGFWRRVAANFIDGMILMLVSFTGIGIILYFVYFPLCEAFWDGSTIGKKAMGLKVVNYNYEKISVSQAFGRYFAKILSAMIIYIGFIMVAFSSKKQGLHDRMAGTYVIRTRKGMSVPR